MREKQIVWGSKGRAAWAFAQQCTPLASESARGQAEGRTVRQWIHRTTECFLGGGWASEREGSEKSFGNYLQLWSLCFFCAIVHTFFIVTQDVITTVTRLKVQRWHENNARLCKLWMLGVIRSVWARAWWFSGGRGAEAAATWAKASVIGS